MNRREFLKLSPLAFLPPLLCGDTKARLDMSIQDMIDNGSHHVVIPPGVYPVIETIHCRPDMSLDLSGVSLHAAADVDVMHGAPRAHITGGYFDCSDVPGYSHAALAFDGSEHHFDVGFPTFVRGLQFLGEWRDDHRGGVAVRLRAEGETGYVFGINLSDIGVAYFGTGIQLSASNAPGGGWVNANQFSNVSMQCCTDFIRLDGGGGNTFTNIQIQPDHTARRALYCTSQFNLMSNFFVWDWPANGTAIELTAPYGYNIITTELLYQWFGSIDNRGQYNRIINSLGVGT